MARVTVEDCTKNVDSLFDLVLLASHRAKVLNAGKSFAKIFIEPLGLLQCPSAYAVVPKSTNNKVSIIFLI